MIEIKMNRKRSRGRSESSSDSSSSSQEKEEGHRTVSKGEQLGKYRVVQTLSDGTFGRVVEASFGDKNYAVKIIRAVKRYCSSALEEKSILQTINKMDRENKFGIVRFIEGFEVGRNYCMVFERLGCSLYDVLKANGYTAFPIHFIQKIAKQLFQTVGFLHDNKLTHTDLKPQNICFVDCKLVQVKKGRENGEYFLPHSTRVKVIDFGGATFDKQHHAWMINTRQYRAPEVILHCCPWSQTSDVWGLACILIELYSGQFFFPVHQNIEHLCMIEIAAGPFPVWMAKDSKDFSSCFRIRHNSHGQQEAELTVSISSEGLKSIQKFKSLKKVIPQEHRCFRDLVKSMLVIDPRDRPSCKQLMKHPFFYTSY